jgi:pimeloyl-ACP methyl ester carboxylesterase
MSQWRYALSASIRISDFGCLTPIIVHTDAPARRFGRALQIATALPAPSLPSEGPRGETMRPVPSSFLLELGCRMEGSTYLRVWVNRRLGWLFLAAAIFPAGLSATLKPVQLAFVLRGEVQRLYHIPAENHQNQVPPPVLFIPGDGGWRGAAVDMGRMLASLGCDVYGLDVRRYLRGFTGPRGGLTDAQLASDMEQVVGEVASRNHQPVILVGWSQGAAMVVATAARAQHKAAIGGVLTIALPESGFLGWRWRDSLLALIGRDAHEPEFQTASLIPDVAPTPLWMIYGTRDRFTPAAAARRLTSLARRPRRHREIKDGNHGLDGHREEFLASVQLGLAWIQSREAVTRRSRAAGAL